jgi:hypothetical protein
MRSSGRAYCFGVLSAVLLAAFPLLGAEGEEDPATAEAEQATKEEALLRAQGKIPETGYETTLQGKYLATTPSEGQRADIPGVFVAQGRTYQVKLQDNALREKLAPFNGKAVTLGGKIRNQGKYFIVEDVLTQAADGAYSPAQSHTAPGRL